MSSSPHGSDFLPPGLGQELQVREVLGEGSHGLVLRAYQPALGRNVVVKLLKLSAVDREGEVLRARFLREARVLAGLTHPHLLPLLDYGEEGDVTYMVYPDDSGTSLENLLRERGPLGEAAVRELLGQVASGLEELHSRELVHRDVKPANLLRREDGSWVLLDLGLVRPEGDGERLTPSGWILGTPAYMSPEACEGQPPSTADDCFALGLVAWEARTGSNPCSTGDPLARMGRRQDLELGALPPGVSPVLAQLLRDLLLRGRDARPSAREVLELLESAGGGERGRTVRVAAGADGPGQDRLEAGEAAPTRVVRHPGAGAVPAPAPPPAPLEGWRRKAVWIGGILALLLFGRWVSTFHRVEPSPGAASGAGPAGPGGPDTLSGSPGEAARLVLLAALERHFEEVAESLPPDPAQWAKVLEILPELPALEQACLRRSEVPGPAEVEAFELLGRRFREMGLWDPIPGLLGLYPSREEGFVLDEPWQESSSGGKDVAEREKDERRIARLESYLEVLPPGVHRSWFLTAGRALARVQRAVEGLEAGFDQVLAQQEPEPPLPEFLVQEIRAPTHLFGGHGKRTHLLRVLRNLWRRSPETRQRLTEFLRPGMIELGILGRAVGRASSILGEERQAALVDGWFNSLKYFLLTPDLLGDTGRWFPSRGKGERWAGLELQFRALLVGPRDVIEVSDGLDPERWGRLVTRFLEGAEGPVDRRHRLQDLIVVFSVPEVSRRVPGEVERLLEVSRELRLQAPVEEAVEFLGDLAPRGFLGGLPQEVFRRVVEEYPAVVREELGEKSEGG